MDWLPIHPSFGMTTTLGTFSSNKIQVCTAGGVTKTGFYTTKPITSSGGQVVTQTALNHTIIGVWRLFVCSKISQLFSRFGQVYVWQLVRLGLESRLVPHDQGPSNNNWKIVRIVFTLCFQFTRINDAYPAEDPQPGSDHPGYGSVTRISHQDV